MIKVLVVEDSKRDMEMYKKILEKKENTEVHYAMSGEEALIIAKQSNIDIFILDIELPGMNGLELAGRIRNLSNYALTLILFITGYTKNQLEAFRQFHCYDYIIKPFSPMDLEKKYIKLLEDVSKEKQKTTRVRMLLYPEADKDVLVPIEKIRYAEVLHRRCYLYTDLKEEPFESNTTILKELIKEVDDYYFIQCHRAFAVNIKKIQEIEQINYRLWGITLQDSEKKLYVSSKYYGCLEEKLKKWISEKRG